MNITKEQIWKAYFDESKTMPETITPVSLGYRIYNKYFIHRYNLYTLSKIIDINIPQKNTDFKNTDENDTKYIDLNATYMNFLNNKKFKFIPIYFEMIDSYMMFADDFFIRLDDDFITVYCDNPDYLDFVKSNIVWKSDDSITVGILSVSSIGYNINYNELPRLDIDLNKTYNDDLTGAAMKRLDKFITKEQTGLAIFYGEPGTGKTTFIRYLIQKYNTTNFIILDSDLLNNISSKQLQQSFIENEGAIYIIEDAEKLVKSRDDGFNSVINSFLNMTDGILASIVKSKFICTFNTKLSNIDNALKRKGRTKFQYEFKKLTLEKTKQLYPDAKEPMTIADIMWAKDENNFSKTAERKHIGFN